MKKIKAIDFFCGAGGLTSGLISSGIDVFAGVDFDISCKKTYEHNNKAIFINKSIVDMKTSEVKTIFKNNTSKNDYKMIVGCAPCQPYSTMNTKKKDNDKRKTLLDEFARVINGVKPHFIIMENVSRLEIENPVHFKNFINMLTKNKYQFSYKVLNAKNFGVSQRRKRLFLIASRVKKVSLSFDKLQEKKDVLLKDVLVNVEKITHDKPSKKDPLHSSLKLSNLNLTRIKATPKNGGRRDAWDKDLLAPSHKKENFKDNYGRLSWDDCSSTITTRFNTYSAGCFGHPEEDRALSLREGALIQTFPKDYMFFGSSSQIARQIGNAVPVNLAKAVGSLFII